MSQISGFQVHAIFRHSRELLVIRQPYSSEYQEQAYDFNGEPALESVTHKSMTIINLPFQGCVNRRNLERIYGYQSVCYGATTIYE